MDGANITYKSVFGNLWGFFLGTGDSLQRIDAPGKWEDLLFAFSRNDITATVREELSYTLWFRGSGARVLRGRITGPRGTAPLVLEIRKWSPLKAQWSVYYRGTVDDTTIIVHADYTEASTKPVGVSQDLIDKADKEYTVTLAGKRIEIPRMWPAGTLGVANTPGTYGKAYDITKTTEYIENYYIVKYKGPTQSDQTGKITYASFMDSTILSANPYWAQSVLNPTELIVAKPGRYRIKNNSAYQVSLWSSIGSPSSPLQPVSGITFLNSGSSDNPVDITTGGVISGGSAWVLINGKKLRQGDVFDGVLNIGDTIALGVGSVLNNPNDISSEFEIVAKPAISNEYNVECRLTFTGSVTIDPIQDIEAVPPLSAPAVRDIDLFAQLCRQVTRRTDLVFDFDRYRPAYFSNPDGSQAAVFLLSLSRLKESVVQDGVATIQGTDEAYFKGLTPRQFYKYFLAQGYKVAVEQRADRDGNFYPVVVVAPYCNSQRQSYYFPRDPATIVDLGTAVTDLELARYAHTFTRVAAGSDPDDFGAYPREEGYQDPCNRRITYAIDGSAGDGDDPYEIEVPWPITTLGLEEALRTFEGENDEARDKRWTEGEGIHLVCGSADTEGQIASITQYDPIPGQFYRPLNLGFRPESLIRRNIPLLCMALDPYDMEDTFFVPDSVEGDDIPVASTGGWNTGDAFLDTYTTSDPVRETYQNPDDPQGENPRGIVRPVMVTLRSTTDQNIYALLHEEATRYGVVRFRHRGKEVAGYLRSVELNPTELSVQKWELLPMWGQDLSFINP